MTDKQKATAVQKYGKLYVPGTTQIADLKRQIEEENPKATPAEIDEILEKVIESAAGNSVAGTPGKGEKGGKNGSVKNIVNKPFSEYRVRPKYKEVLDAMDKPVGKKLIGFDKLEWIRDTSISQDTADILNAQSESTFTRLYPKDSE